MRNDEFDIIDRVVSRAVKKKRLKWMSAIEDIKAEIQETIDSTPYHYHDYEDGRIDAYEDCLELLDKHIEGVNEE